MTVWVKAEHGPVERAARSYLNLWKASKISGTLIKKPIIAASEYYLLADHLCISTKEAWQVFLPLVESGHLERRVGGYALPGMVVIKSVYSSV